MTSMGDTLRRERLRRGWELKKVSAETKIGLHFLEAIEADQFDRLPGGVFAKSFIRQYAHLLGVDDGKIAAELKSRFDEPAEALPAPEPPHSALHLPRLPALDDFRDRLRSDSSISAFVWLVAVVLGCAAVYGFWQSRRPAAKNDIATVSRAAPAAPTPRGGATQPDGVKEVGNERERAVVKETPAVRDPGGVAEPASLSTNVPALPEQPRSGFRPAEVTESGTIKVPTAPTPPSPAPQVDRTAKPETVPASQSAPAALRAAFTATERVWLSIRSDGTRTFSGTLEARESKQFDAARKISVLVGNAGGLQIKLNGKSVGVIGPPGQIQLLVLTPHGAHIVPRNPPISEDSPAPAAAAAARP